MSFKTLGAIALAMTLIVCASAQAQTLETEPNNSRTQANSIAVGAPVRGQAGDTSDDDWFKFTTSSTGTIAVTVSAANEIRPGFQIQDAVGNTIASKGLDLFGATATVEAAAPAGTYYVRVESSLFSAGRAYTVTVATSSSSSGLEVEPNGIQAQANALTSGTAIHGQVSSSSDEDWFRLDVSAAGTVSVSLVASSSNGIRPAVELRSSAGTVIASSPASLFAASASLQANANVGAYYIRVAPDIFGGDHNYDLTVFFTGTTSPVVPSPSASVTRIAPVYFSNAPTVHSYVRIINSGTTAGQVQITVRDELGNLLGTWKQQIAANSAPQFDISTLEAAVGISPPATPPSRPGAFARLDISSDFDGYAQHVLWNPAGGSLTTMSVCDQGASANASFVSNVHTSNITAYPSQIVLTNTTSLASTATLEVLDSASGNKLGTWTSSVIPANGSIVVAAAKVQADIGFSPSSTQSHMTLKFSGTAPGTIGHYISNIGAGVLTDMTARCVLTKTTLP